LYHDIPRKFNTIKQSKVLSSLLSFRSEPSVFPAAIYESVSKSFRTESITK